MANVNKVLLLGRLTKDPELRYTPSGAAVCDLTVAINHVYKTKEGEKKEDACFVDVTVWQKQAENCAEYLKKGSSLFVEGRLVQDRWEDKDGQKRSKLKVQAGSIQFIGGRPQGSEGEAAIPEDAGQPDEQKPPSDVPF